MQNLELYKQVTDLLNNNVEYLTDIIESTDEWEILFDKDGVFAMAKSNHPGMQFIRSIAILNFSYKQIAKLIRDPDQRMNWDNMVLESKIVHEFNKHTKIYYEKFYSPWPVQCRDFVYAAKIMKVDDGLLIITKSIDGIVPEIKGNVRGEIFVSGYLLKRIRKRITEVTYVVYADAKGKFPESAVKHFAKKQCMNLNRIRKIMAEKNIGKKIVHKSSRH